MVSAIAASVLYGDVGDSEAEAHFEIEKSFKVIMVSGRSLFSVRTPAIARLRQDSEETTPSIIRFPSRTTTSSRRHPHIASKY